MKLWFHGSTLGGLIKSTMRQRLNVDAGMTGNRLGGSAKTAPVYRTPQPEAAHRKETSY